MTLRDRFCYFLHTRVSGRREGMMPARWVQCIRLLLQPSRLACHFYDPLSDCYVVEGFRLPGYHLRHIRRMALPSDWVRIVRINADGTVMLEMRREHRIGD